MNTFIYFILIIVLFLILWKILKGVIKALLSLLTILIIFSLILGGLVYQDVKDIQTKLKTDSVLLLLEKNNNIIAGATLSPGQENTSYLLLDEQTITNYNSLYQNKDISSINSKTYKTMIINYEALISLVSDPIQIEKDTMSKVKAGEILTSENPFSAISSYFPQYSEAQIKTLLRIKDGTELKSSMFLILLTQNKDISNLIPSYQEGKIQIYPETILFKTLKYIPENILPTINFA